MNASSSKAALLSAAACLLAAHAATAQCEPSFVLNDLQGPSGLNGIGNGIVRWDPDGAGPQHEVLVVAGNYNGFGRVAANRVGYFDEYNLFHPMGSGVGSLVSVSLCNAVTVHNGDVYVAGNFQYNGDGVEVNSIARWNQVTSTWDPVGAGLATATGTFATVNSLVSWNGKLVAGGVFLQSGPNQVPTTTLNRIAWFDSSTNTWQPFAAGFTAGPAGFLGWTVNALAVHNGDLYAGGNFIEATDGNPVYRVAKWNPPTNAWVGLGTGANNGVGAIDAANVNVNAMTSYNGSLYVGGDFTTVVQPDGSSPTFNRIARWTGSTWAPVGPVGTGTNVGLSGTVYSMQPSTSSLYVGGNFLTAAAPAGGTATVTLNRAAKLNPATNTWSAFGNAATPGLNTFVRGITDYNGQVYVTGNFTDAGPNTTTPVNGARGVARFDPTSGLFTPLVKGAPNQPIDACTYWNGNLVVGGEFSTIGGIAARRVAMFDGTNWTAFGNGLGNTTFGNSIDYDTVLSLAVYNNELYAGGGYGYTNGGPRCFAKWNGSSWVDLNAQSIVYSLVVYNNKLIAGGLFSSINGTPANRVAQFDGSNWSQVGAGFTGSGSSVYVVAEHNGDLYAGGGFSNQPDGLSYIARFDGTNWVSVGPGLERDPAGGANTINPGVWTISTYNGMLFAGGRFNRTKDLSVEGLNSAALWDGNTWAPLGGGVTTAMANGQWSTVVHSTVIRGTLVATGDFNSSAANGGRFNGVTYFDPALNDWKTIGNNSIGTTYLSLGGFTGSGRSILQLDNGNVFIGGDFNKANNNYSIYSSEIYIPCPADFNCDASVDFFDYLDFVDAFSSTAANADFNHDQSIDFFDYLDFVNAFSSGC